MGISLAILARLRTDGLLAHPLVAIYSARPTPRPYSDREGVASPISAVRTFPASSSVTVADPVGCDANGDAKSNIDWADSLHSTAGYKLALSRGASDLANHTLVR